MSRDVPSLPEDLAAHLVGRGWLVAPPAREGEPLADGRYLQELDDPDQWRMHEVPEGARIYHGRRLWGPVEVSQ